MFSSAAWIRDAERYETLKREVAAVGLIRRGSLVRRPVVCGKTVTVRVNKAEAKLLAKWIADGRRLTKIVAQLERTSLRLTER